MLRYSHEAALPAEFVTLLLPISDAAAPAGALRRFAPPTTPADNVVAYAYDAQDVSHRFFFSEGGAGWRLGDWESDARFVYAAVSAKSGQLSAASVVGGSRLGFEGESRTPTDPAADHWTWRS